MNAEIYDDIALEELVKDQFGRTIDIKQVVARDIPTSHTTKASVFLTDKNQLYVLITGRAPLTLGDIRKMVKRMGMAAESYLPPKHDAQYFDRIAEAKFKETFPGRHVANDQDLMFYRLLVPYNPALILVQEVTDGVIRQFDASDNSNWRAAAKLTYRRIKAS